MTIDDLPPITPDPVIEAFKTNVDRSLLRELLALTVDERIERAQATADLAWEVRRAVAAVSPKRRRREDRPDPAGRDSSPNPALERNT